MDWSTSSARAFIYKNGPRSRIISGISYYMSSYIGPGPGLAFKISNVFESPLWRSQYPTMAVLLNSAEFGVCRKLSNERRAFHSRSMGACAINRIRNRQSQLCHICAVNRGSTSTSSDVGTSFVKINPWSLICLFVVCVLRMVLGYWLFLCLTYSGCRIIDMMTSQMKILRCSSCQRYRSMPSPN